MPDFTKITAAEINIDRKLYAAKAKLIALRRDDDQAGWHPVTGFWNDDGVIRKNWAPYDYGDGVHLRIKIAQLPPLTNDILKLIDAFAFWRDTKKAPNDVQVFVILRETYPEIYSGREFQFSCQKLEPYVASLMGAPFEIPMEVPA